MPIRWYYEIIFYLECGVEFKISRWLLTVFFKTNECFEIIYIGAMQQLMLINILLYLCVKKKVHFICVNIV